MSRSFWQNHLMEDIYENQDSDLIIGKLEKILNYRSSSLDLIGGEDAKKNHFLLLVDSLKDEQIKEYFAIDGISLIEVNKDYSIRDYSDNAESDNRYFVLVDDDGFERQINVNITKDGIAITSYDAKNIALSSSETFALTGNINDLVINYAEKINGSKKFEKIKDIIEITKDNIADYYEFMNKTDKNKNARLISEVLFERLYSKEFDTFIREIPMEVLLKNSDDIAFRDLLVETSYFGIKDTLKPIDEYITEIEKSLDFQKYVTNSVLSKIQNNEVVSPSEYSKIDSESEAFKSLDTEVQTTITDYINEQSDKIVNAALEEEKLKQEQSICTTIN